MTLISDELRLVYVHVPKTAGTSVKAALAAVDSTGRWLPTDPANKHLSARQVRERCRLPQSYVWCATVRSPFEQLVSFWTYKMENPFHPDYAHVAGFGTFDRWVRWLAGRGWSRQCAFTHDRDGQPIVDALLRHERLADDWAALAERIGSTSTLPRKNTSGHSDIGDYYDDALRDFVVEHWADDFDRLGYPTAL